MKKYHEYEIWKVKVSATQIIAWIWNNYKFTLGSLQVKVIVIQV